jgi:hypothetical protein
LKTELNLPYIWRLNHTSHWTVELYIFHQLVSFGTRYTIKEINCWWFYVHASSINVLRCLYTVPNIFVPFQPHLDVINRFQYGPI